MVWSIKWNVRDISMLIATTLLYYFHLLNSTLFLMLLLLWEAGHISGLLDDVTDCVGAGLEDGKKVSRIKSS